MNRNQNAIAELQELAHDIGSNVVIFTDPHGNSKYDVDGLTFDTIDAAIRHCREVA